MQLRNSRFIRMGSRIGVGVLVTAVLAVLPITTSSATHETSLALNSATAGKGTPAVLTGTVNGPIECGANTSYGWELTSPNGTVDGARHSEPNGPASGSFTVTVDTSGLAPGNYQISVTADWLAPAGCADGPNTTVKANLKVTARKGTFVCKAYAARTQTDYQPANPAFSPCKDDNNYFAQLQPILGLGNIGAVRATTDNQPNNLNDKKPAKGDYGVAQGEVAQIALKVNGVQINLGAVWARAKVECAPSFLSLTPKLSTSGGVATLVVNGKAVAVASGYVSIYLPGVRIELNKVTKSSFGKVVTRQAVKITNRLNGQAIVIGEATAGYSGSPCNGFV